MAMGNPWLHIPYADYVGHMSSPAVGQYAVLNRLLSEALAVVRPASVLVLGCSAGNGFEHIEPAVTSRVVGVDINPAYLRRLREQFRHPAFTLDVLCTDVMACEWPARSFDLVHAALILEYLEWPRLLPSIANALRPGGVLNVVLQQPSTASSPVTPTRFTSLRTLESIFRFVDAEALVGAAVAHALAIEARRTEPVTDSKAFEVLRFRNRTAASEAC